ncbi:MAG: ATP-binding protein [Candidatus Hermodarchaeota archaeon]
MFLLKDSNYILENFNDYVIEVFNFNISVIFLCSAIVFYFLNLFKADKNIIDLENPSYKASKDGSVKIGRIMKGDSKKYNFALSLKDLEKHMFICGSTGTGKSNFIQNFLINFTRYHEKPFFLVEFKGEYHFLQDKVKDLIILWPGENFSINIFDPLEANPKIHAERIFDILKSGQLLDDNAEYSPQMERVLIEILTTVCENKNMQSWEGFEKNCKTYLANNQDKIPMLKQTLISLKNRIRRFSIGPMKAIFDTDTTLPISNLFNQKVILDLSSIIRLGGEKEDALFFLNMVLKYLWDRNLTKGANNYNGINHITIIEDAQYFAPQDISKKSKLTSYLEDIALLQRGTGECLITIATRPNISKEILANNGVVLTFKNHIEKDIMCELLNLNPEKKNYLSILEEGYCIIRVNSIKEPFLLGIPYIKRGTITVSDINRKNQQILENNQIKIVLKPFKSIKESTLKYPEYPKLPKNKNNSSFKLYNEEKEVVLLLNKNRALSKNDYDNFKAFINKLYSDQEKNK